VECIWKLLVESTGALGKLREALSGRGLSIALGRLLWCDS
jgi:hypothetical protein